MTSCVPDLRLDGLGVYGDGSCCELDTDGRLGIEIELIACETAEKVGFTNARVSDEDDCKNELLVPNDKIIVSTFEEELQRGDC